MEQLADRRMDNNNSLYPQLRCSIIGGDSTVQMGTSAFAGRPASGDWRRSGRVACHYFLFISFLFLFFIYIYSTFLCIYPYPARLAASLISSTVIIPLSFLFLSTGREASHAKQYTPVYFDTLAVFVWLVSQRVRLACQPTNQ